MKATIMCLVLGILLGIFAEKIDLPLKLQMWGSFYTLPTKKHITIDCLPNNKLYAVTDEPFRRNSIDIVCYQN